MFEKYAEKARRVIFFARMEANQCGADAVAPEHLLLGLLHEDRHLRKWIAIENVRSRISGAGGGERAARSVDLPLEDGTKQAMWMAAAEADRLGSRRIDCLHLALGLLVNEESLAAVLLVEYGVTRERIEEALMEGDIVAAVPIPRIGPLAQPLTALISVSKAHLRRIDAAEAAQALKRRGWTRQQALGHLVDLATTHHGWFARAMVEPRVDAAGYPDAAWAAAQRYDLLPWEELLVLWERGNQLLIHVLSAVPAERFETPCRIGVGPAVPLRELAEEYCRRVEDVVGEILMRAE